MLTRTESRHVKQVDVYDSPRVQKAFSDKKRELKARGSDDSQIWEIPCKIYCSIDTSI